MLRTRGSCHARFTRPCDTGLQVNLMRFSAIFQLSAVRQDPATREHAAEPMENRMAIPPAPARAAASPGTGLPDELDARVRLVGEWQLGDAC
jgi:hypothetical protein